MNSLSSIDRQVFLARRLDRMSYAEIAKRSGLSPAQVERAMRRAIREIGRYLRGAPRRRWRWPF